MRILHVYKDVYPPVAGGIERHIDSIRQALPDLEHDVLICGRRLRTRIRQPRAVGRNGREILVGEFGRVLSTPIAPTFPLWLRRYAARAIVHVHMPQPVGELSALIARGDSPLVATYHADIFRQRALLFAYQPLVVKCLREADTVIVASERLRRHSPLIRLARIDPEVIPYGIDPERWRRERVDEDKEAALRSRFGSQFVLTVGRLVPYKGLHWLVDAARQLEAPVVIVGEGISRPALEAQVEALGLRGRVHLVGGVDDDWLAAYFAAAAVFVLTSWNRAEAFGIVVLEAQAAGLPVVVTDVGTGTIEAFEPGESGLAIPPRNVPALVRAVNGLLAEPERARQMGEAGERRVRSRNSLESLANALRPVYERLADKAGQSAR